MMRVFPADAIRTCNVRLGTYPLGSVSTNRNDNQHRRLHLQWPRQRNSESAALRSDRIGGGHAVRIPRAGGGMNADSSPGFWASDLVT